MKLLLSLPFFLPFFTSITPMALPSPRNLPYMDYMSPDDYSYPLPMDNDISRTLPKRKPLNPYDSPIYYIRLPPQPYMFVPGLGYISQPPPPPPPVSPFVSLPVNFVSNGKPSTIYQWASGMEFDNEVVPQKKKPQKGEKPRPQKVDSNVHKLEGDYVFNGKPENVFVLRDSYNSLYGDALQNFYP